MSIQRRLALSITLVLVVSLIVGFGLTYGHVLNKVRTEMQAALNVGAYSAISAIDAKNGAVDPEKTLRAVVHDFDGDRHLRAELVAPNGQVVAQSRLLPPDESAPAWFFRIVASGMRPRVLALPASFSRAGSVVLYPDPHNEVAEAWSDLALTLTIMVVFFAMVLALAFLTIRAALAPLRDVCDALLRIGRGDLTARIEPDVSRELMPLRDGFNAMASRLAEMDGQNRMLNEQIINLQEEERAELARDLHDDVAPFVFAVGADAAMIRQYLAKGATAEIGARAEGIAEAVRHMQRHLKDVLGRLAPGALLDLGLSGAVENLIAFWKTRRPLVSFTHRSDGDPLDPPLDAVAFRIVQECMSNAIRHGDPTRIDIAIGTDDDLATIVVEDDGAGFSNGEARFGFGLTGMNERVRSVGGTLRVANREAGRGVIIRAELPLKRQRMARNGGTDRRMDASV